MTNEHEKSKQHKNKIAIASLVTGIIGVCSIPLIFIGLPELFSTLAVFFGVIGIKQAKLPGIDGRRIAVAGIVLGIIGWILMIVLAILIILAILGGLGNWW